MRGRHDPSERPLPASSRLGVVIQLSLVAAVGMLALAPPARGVMLLVPLAPGSAQALDEIAGGAHATLYAPGPLPGSRYVDADRAALLPRALRRGVLLLAGDLPLCATPPPQEEI